MAITFHGVASVPVDNGSNATNQITITPPTSMLSGDLVLAYCRQRGTGVWSVGVTGGQTWTTYDTPDSTNISVQTFYCVFNGTWSVNPRFDSSAATHTSCQMLVFRPSTGYRFIVPLYLQTSNQSSSATVTVSALNHTQPSNLSIAGWHSADDNTWGNITGAGWIKTGLAAQYRNLAGSDGSCTYAYRIGTATGTTGTVAQTQLTLGTDLTRWSHIGFYEEIIQDPPEAPILTSPANNATNVPINTTFSFSAVDPQNDPIRYRLVIFQGVPEELIALQDDFNETSLSLDKWAADFLTGSIQQTGGRIRLSVNASSSGGYAQIYSANSGSRTFYDFTGKGCIVEAFPDTVSTTTDSYIELYLDVNNRIWFGYRNNQIYAQTKIGGTNSALLAPTTYNATAMKWWRLRESSGTFFWDYSQDEVNWTNFYNMPNPFAVTALSVALIIFQNSSEGSARIAEFDNFNIGSGIIHDDVISGTDPGFTGTPDNTDPYTSGQTVSYVDPTGLDYNTTYNWRVSAIDPTGSNTFGHWSETRTFTTEALAGSTFNESASLSINTTDTYTLQLTLDALLTLSTNKVLESVNVNIINETILIDSTNLLESLGTSIINTILSLNADLQEDVVASLTISDSVVLSTDKNISSLANVVLQEVLSLTSNQNVSALNINTLEASSIISGVHDVSSQSINIMNNSISLISNHDVSALGGININEVLTLSIANQIVSVNNIIVNETLALNTNVLDSYDPGLVISTVLNLSSSQQLSSSSINTLQESINLTSANELSSIGGQIINVILSLTSDNQLSTTAGLVLNETVLLLIDSNIATLTQHILQEILILSTSNQVSSINNIIANDSININSSNDVTAASSGVINLSLTLNTSNQISSVIELTINETVSLLLNSVFTTADTAFFFYNEAIVLSISSDITSSALAVLQATAVITSANNLSSDSVATFLASVSLDTNISQGDITNIGLSSTVSLQTSKGIITVAAVHLFEAIAIAAAFQDNYSAFVAYQASTEFNLTSEVTSLVEAILNENLLLNSNTGLTATYDEFYLENLSLSANVGIQVLSTLISNNSVILDVTNTIDSQTQSFSFDEAISLVLNGEFYVDGVKDGILILRYKSNAGPLTIKFKPKE